jgi:hypothetical protein
MPALGLQLATRLVPIPAALDSERFLMSSLTKMLVVLQLVFSLVLSVAIVLMVSKQEPYKTELDAALSGQKASAAMLVSAQQKLGATEQNLAAAQGDVTKLTNRVNQLTTDMTNAQAKSDTENLALKAENGRLTAQNSALQTANATATQTIGALNAELTDLRPRVADLTTKYNEIYRSKNESDNQLRAAEQAIRKLQEQLQAALSAPAATGTAGATASISGPGTEGQVQVLSNAASAGGPINGKVGKIQEVRGLILFEVPMGARDGIKEGTKLFVYRGNSYVADAMITVVTPDVSVAKITTAKAGETVKEGDMVSTIGQ